MEAGSARARWLLLGPQGGSLGKTVPRREQAAGRGKGVVAHIPCQGEALGRQGALPVAP